MKYPHNNAKLLETFTFGIFFFQTTLDTKSAYNSIIKENTVLRHSVPHSPPKLFPHKYQKLAVIVIAPQPLTDGYRRKESDLCIAHRIIVLVVVDLDCHASVCLSIVLMLHFCVSTV